MRPRTRFIIVFFITVFALAWCSARVNAQERHGRQSHPGYRGQQRGEHRAVPRQHIDRGRSYDRHPFSGYSRSPHHRTPSWGYRQDSRRFGYNYRYRFPYGYRDYGYRGYYGYGYRHSIGCTAVLYDIYGRPHWVSGYWSRGLYRDVCTPY